MDKNTYDNYKTTMALYLAPNSLFNRGRLTNQWSLEKV
jgi:hypothetical protein